MTSKRKIVLYSAAGDIGSVIQSIPNAGQYIYYFPTTGSNPFNPKLSYENFIVSFSISHTNLTVNFADGQLFQTCHGNISCKLSLSFMAGGPQNVLRLPVPVSIPSVNGGGLYQWVNYNINFDDFTLNISTEAQITPAGRIQYTYRFKNFPVDRIFAQTYTIEPFIQWYLTNTIRNVSSNMPANFPLNTPYYKRISPGAWKLLVQCDE